MRSIELLAPARNLECGLEAIRHGADAVYIGAPRFGARAAAGNSVEDIADLTAFAHKFCAKIYVTVNTLLYDEELPDVDRLIDELAGVGVDALIVQDERLMALNRGRIPLHASTQMDNRTVDDVRTRAEAGYEQTVLARELSLEEIRAIHEAVPEMTLEAFVHGALCVSYSGRCYASEYCFGRSANRGECAQFCRLPFDLVDGQGRVLRHPDTGKPLRQRHLLSLRDMNRSADIEAMMDAGVSSFKIEGRLKDVAYVKNVTAFYRRLIDVVLHRRSADYCRASYGHTSLTFAPNLDKSFNRRFIDYFMHGRTPNLVCLSTPKAIGEPVGTVKDVLPGRSLAIAGTASFANGDGLCFFDADDRLQGFRVNRVDEHGRIYPADPSVLRQLRKGQQVFRNLDADFERQLSRPTADRRIGACWTITDEPATGFTLTLSCEDGRVVTKSFDHPHEQARTPQHANIRKQLMRLGDTVYTTTEADIIIRFTDNWFIPSSTLTEWRREMTASEASCKSPEEDGKFRVEKNPSFPAGSSEGESSLPKYQSALSVRDVSHKSRTGKQEAFSSPLMTCRYCIRYELGQCRMGKNGLAERHNLHIAPDEPLALRLADGRTFPLHFDCRNCQMLVLIPE